MILKAYTLRRRDVNYLSRILGMSSTGNTAASCLLRLSPARLAPAPTSTLVGHLAAKRRALYVAVPSPRTAGPDRPLADLRLQSLADLSLTESPAMRRTQVLPY